MLIGWFLLARQDHAVENWIVTSVVCVVLLALALIGGVVVLWFRKRYVVGKESGPTDPLSLSDLREMYAKSLVSEEEFERLRDMIILEARASVGLATEEDNETSPASDKPSAKTGGDGEVVGQRPTDCGNGEISPGETEENEPEGDR